MHTSIIKSNTVLILLGLLVSVFMCVLPHTTHASLTDGLVGHWTFDGKDTTWTSSTTGTTRDLSGNGNTGTLTNMKRATAPKAGKVGQGMNFNGGTSGANGANNRVSIPASASIQDINTNKNMTVVLWAKKKGNSISQPSIMTLFNKGPYGGNGDQVNAFDFYWSRTGTDSFGVWIGTTPYDSGVMATPNNEWVHLAFTLESSGGDSTAVRLYRNGVQVYQNLSPTTDLSFNNALPQIGSYTDRPYTFNGLTDDVRIYNRALSVTEINQLYKQGATRLGVTPSRNITSASTTCTGISCGLVGHWTFDGKDTTWTSATVGTTRDLSGNGNTGTLTSMNRATAPKAGKIGQALKFDGEDDQINLGKPATLNNLSSFSYSLWVDIDGSPESNRGVIIIKGNYADGDIADGPFLKLTTAVFGNWAFMGGVGFDTTDAIVHSQNIYNSGSGKFIIEGWQHVTMTFDGTTKIIKLYINGVEANYQTNITGSGVRDDDSSHNVYIGNNSAAQRTFNGKIDDAHIYNRALSASEVTQLYKKGATRLGVTPSRNITSASTTCTGISCGLVGHWTFDGKDTTWTSSTTGTTGDLSGNGNTGTLSAMNRATTPKTGKVGQGMNFDGVNDYINLGTPTNHGFTDASSQFTITAWVKPTVTSRMGFVKRGPLTSGTPSAQYVLGTYVNNNLEFAIGNGTVDSTLYTGNNSLPLNNWSFISCGMDVTTLFCYINGVFAGQISRTINASGNGGAATTIIGTRSTTFEFFKGDMDDVRIYNRALSATEIGKLYKLGQTKMR